MDRGLVGYCLRERMSSMCSATCILCTLDCQESTPCLQYKMRDRAVKDAESAKCYLEYDPKWSNCIWANSSSDRLVVVVINRSIDSSKKV